MENDSILRKRYRVSFYKDGVLVHELAALGVDDRNALEVAKKHLRDDEGVDWSTLDYVVEPRPLTVRLGDREGIEVHRL